ncbi:ABC transporter ATP-binding protein [Cytophagaceae bacterium DM2B3-1]|uniref:ABC transporter ATP-binding protein n=1 Tax=Xanthocytophaga flava TaxID=3048013 RepID=A0ABT7CCY1_9BACT|nr:ABC transporter ATP-binding protein [Xanthocytophaga flavus]MDJ1470685.1 ABC transporter ATP-binding protein [Xanthocytophaga flavus]MDJ1491472.1 ABC transporter ATP-binding protein [Xanthocytophaga flavus]
MIEVKNISKSYNTLQVLKGIDLVIRRKEVVSIVGASGAGKSTLLHIMGTLDKPDTGLVRINGQDVVNLRSSALADFRNQNIGFIFQFHNLLPEFTALENVCIPGYLSNKDAKKVQARATELLIMLGLKNRLDHTPSRMSGGEQQRTSVARALINSPLVVFADEPSGNLDSKNAQELHQLFFRLRDEIGQTFVIVTHNEELANMADRKLEMKDGKILIPEVSN